MVKSYALLIILIMALQPSNTLHADLVRQTREVPAETCGDVNEDETVDVFDAIATLQIVVGKITPTPAQVVLSDVVRDGNTNVFDVILMLQHIVGKAEITGCGPLAIDVGFTLIVEETTIEADTVFVVGINVIPAEGIKIDAAQVHLRFDPSVLQVVDESGDPSESSNAIIPGPIFDSGQWEDILLRAVDNSAGSAIFAGGRGSPAGEGAPADAQFLLATIRFKAITVAATTAIQFNTDPRAGLVAKAVQGFEELTADHSNVTLTITAPHTQMNRTKILSSTLYIKQHSKVCLVCG